MSSESITHSSKLLLQAEGIQHLIMGSPHSKLASAVLALVYYRCRSHYYQKQQELQKSTKAKGDWDNDLDDEVRECTVSLVSKGMFFNQAHHISVQFEFDGGYQVTYEAFEQEGKLNPHWRPGTAVGEKTDIGTLQISPKILNIKAKQNKFNWQKYSLLFMNCQTWIIEFLTSLQVSLITIGQYIERKCSKMELLLKEGVFTTISGGVDLLYALYLRLRTAYEDGTVLGEFWEVCKEECTALVKPITDAVKIINTRSQLALDNISLLFTDPVEFFRRVFK